MWLKFIIVLITFYFAAMLQNSFFTHFILCTANLSLLFIVFFTIIFFDKRKDLVPIILYSFAGGFISDAVFNYNFGTSILSLLAIGILIQKAKSSLIKKNKEYPIYYFLVVFLIAFILYHILIISLVGLIDYNALGNSLKVPIVKTFLCNILFAIIAYFVYKKAILVTNGKDL